MLKKYNFILFISFMFPFLACEETASSTEEQAEIMVNIFVFDQSDSAKYLNFDTAELRKLIYEDAEDFKVYIAGIRILKEKSIEQEVLLSGPLHLSLYDEGQYSIYQETDAKNENSIAKKAFDDQVSQILLDFNDTIVNTRNRANSDINGALVLAQRLCNQRRFHDAIIRLIILSDLNHDLSGNLILDPKIFPPNVTIYPIGTETNVNLNKVFPNNDIDGLVSFTADFFLNNPKID